MDELDVRIGINPISWSNDDLPSLGGETPLEVALSEGKEIGYQGFELGNKFPRESKALARVAGSPRPCARLRLVFGPPRDTQRRRGDRRRGVRICASWRTTAPR
jgi:sugar phosphate isomerase/epimerase